MKDEISHCLELADRGDQQSLHRFYELLLAATVFVPLSPFPTAKPEQQATIRPDTAVGNQHDQFLSVEFEGSVVVPFFTEERHISAWAQQEFQSKELPFSKLLFSIGPEVVLHLNPGQAVGKQLDASEIERLRSGEAAIPELVADYFDSDEDLIQLESDIDEYRPTLHRLNTTLEAYEDIEEAFLLSIQLEGRTERSLLLGFRHANLTEEKARSIADEFLVMLDEQGKRDVHLELVPSVDSQGPYRSLFQGLTPFYVKTKSR